MTQFSSGRQRTAKAEDGVQLLRPWALLFDESGATSEEQWKGHAREWFTRCVDDTRNARFPAIEVDDQFIATAIGTLDTGVPSPQRVRRRTVCLANVITLPGHRGQGHGTMLVFDIVAWARSIAADRIELSATPAGQPLYEKLGFTMTSAPAHEARSLKAPSGDPAPTASRDDRARTNQHGLQLQKWIT